VTAAKLAAGAVSSNSIASGGLSLASTAAWSLIINADLGGAKVSANDCRTLVLSNAVPGAQAGDVVVPVISQSSGPAFVPPGIQISGVLFNSGFGDPGLDAVLCNLTSTAQTLPANFPLNFYGYR
jgi:hypothetical protein